MARIFITYRSEDPGWSVVLDRELSIVFGPDQVFRASRTMQMGESFPERIRLGVTNASVLLAVIGPRWLEQREGGLRRIDEPGDWVRREIRLALENGLLIVPVLVDGVRPLSPDELPDDIRAIADRQYIRLSHKEADSDIGLLVERLRQRVPGLQMHQKTQDRPHTGGQTSVGGSVEQTAPGQSVSLWLVLTGLALLLLSLWLPWVDHERAVELGWDEWEYSVLFPRGVLALAGLGTALYWLLRGTFEAVAMGLVALAGVVAVFDPLWVRRQLLDNEYPFVIGMGVWVAVLSGVVLLVAVGLWVRGRPASEPRHARNPSTVATGGILILMGQFLQVTGKNHWFTVPVAIAVLIIVAAVLVPPSIPESVRIAVLSGFTAFAVVSVVAAVNYVALHPQGDASLTDAMGRIVLNVVIALGLWVALSRPVPARVPAA
ncbi:toll/interleukin-1 receptor domain-containing protein [Kineosporia sp. NBRC 101731]|uniref:toll/interleukin-1 receptor domain-containing protein n=1 Tax=Kineosporia sp. NBRC 101731 TaxID=3032199 RepID=UPI0024A55D9E|nr:toll/interleukin-1 receptor domain-containing protein [Kineosporia sp. NBRC 101731]GLY30931.1 hypothetical protein Kisp02_42960 [Kineosporia sp. NBRC 101731]